MDNPEHGIRIRSSARTDTGQVRDNNEDNIFVWIQFDHAVLAVVADGMGGAVAGEEASRIAIETIRDELVDPTIQTIQKEQDFVDEDSISDWMQSAISDANINIVDASEARPQLKGMGTTVTMAFVYNQTAILAHVGDSRAYVVDGDDGHIEQITSDHSFVQALVAAGHITAEEAEVHPMRNVLYRALGQARDLDVDVYIQDMQIGDSIVLCSDGLTLHVQADEIGDIVFEEDDPDVASQKLVDLANERGGRDNISVIVVRVEGELATSSVLEASTDMPVQQHDLGSSEVVADPRASQQVPRVPPDDGSTGPKMKIITQETTAYGEGSDPHISN